METPCLPSWYYKMKGLAWGKTTGIFLLSNLNGSSRYYDNQSAGNFQCGESLILLLGYWLGFDFGLGQGSRLKMNTAEECVLCILMGLVKTLNTVIMGPLFMLHLFIYYFMS